MAEPRLVVVSGPSGVGKTSVCTALAQRPDYERVVSATTRAPRGGERHGVDYLFLSEDEFRELEARGGLLESAQVHENRYGTPRDQAERILAAGRHALLNIDVQGAASVRASGLPCFTVFLLPPSQGELEARLRRRGTDSDEAVARRLAAARTEMERRAEFDLQVLNDRVERAADEIAAAVASA